MWNGAWSPGSAEWQSLDNKIVDRHPTGAGESWINIDDLYKCFYMYTPGAFKSYVDETSMSKTLGEFSITECVMTNLTFLKQVI